jgi:hypothetical protein
MAAEAAVPDEAPRAPVRRVRFVDPDEFVRELKARGPDVEPVVRLTRRWRPDPAGLPLRHLSVAAGYARRARGALVLYELDHYAGEVWQGLNGDASRRTLERARRTHGVVERAARGLGLEVAAGVYDAASTRVAA